MAEVLKGASCAKALTEELAERTNALKEKGVTPTLALLRVGERGDDIAYENAAVKRCEKVGIEVKKFLLPADAKKEEILSAIRTINIDESIHGCLMFRPLADKDIESAAARLLLPEKDVDCMTVGSLATVFSGGGAGYPPCTAEAVVRLLKYYDVPLAGRKVTVAGRSLVIGKPVSMLLLAENATVTICHSRTADLAAECRNADIVVAAIGKAKLLSKEFFKKGQIVVDVGINVDSEGNMCGDCDFDAAETIVSAITPVPGGVGSVTTAVLCGHVVEAAEKASARL